MVKPKGWSFSGSQGIPSHSDMVSMSLKLYMNCESCWDLGEEPERSMMDLEQSSPNSSDMSLFQAVPLSQMWLPVTPFFNYVLPGTLQHVIFTYESTSDAEENVVTDPLVQWSNAVCP